MTLQSEIKANLLMTLLLSSEIILKQLFVSGSVNISKYLLSLRLGKYSPIFTSPLANNC